MWVWVNEFVREELEVQLSPREKGHLLTMLQTQSANLIKKFFRIGERRNVIGASAKIITYYFTYTGFPRYSRGLRSWKIVNHEYQNSCFKPKIG